MLAPTENKEVEKLLWVKERRTDGGEVVKKERTNGRNFPFLQIRPQVIRKNVDVTVTAPFRVYMLAHHSSILLYKTIAKCKTAVSLLLSFQIYTLVNFVSQKVMCNDKLKNVSCIIQYPSVCHEQSVLHNNPQRLYVFILLSVSDLLR